MLGGGSITLFHVRGIRIAVDWSWFLILFFLIVSMSGAYGETLGEPSTAAAPFALAVASAVGFFGSILLHELGHAFAALRRGIGILSIQLWIFGGVARMDRESDSPRTEFEVAVAGPLATVGVVGGCFLLGSALGGPSEYWHALRLALEFHSDPGVSGIVSMLAWLAAINLFVLAFNLLPAFPMDGGRLFRAALSSLIGREQATRIAVWLGTALAVCLAGVGLWWRDIVLPLIAAFVIIAAYAEGRVVRLEEAMRRLRVGQFAVWDRGGVEEDDLLSYALRGGPRDVVVTRDGRVVGMVPRNALLQVLHGGADHRTVGEAMDTDVVTVDADESVYDVQRKMQMLNRWTIPVTEGGQYRGVFTADRVIHVYRYLNAQSAERRRWQDVAGAVGELFRAVGR